MYVCLSVYIYEPIILLVLLLFAAGVCDVPFFFPCPLSSGHRREVANSEDVVRWLKDPKLYWNGDSHRLPFGAQKIQVNYITEIGTNLASQAQQFWETDLIVLSHGATTGRPPIRAK